VLFLIGTATLERIIRVRNKGAYTAISSLSFYLNDELQVKKFNLLAQQEQTLTYEYGASSPIILEINALAGKQVLKAQIDELKACWHIWGTTLIPYSSRIDC
jgi:hypothetical protein